MRALGWLVLVAGCGGTTPVDPCEGVKETCVALRIDPWEVGTKVDRLHLHVTGDNKIDEQKDSAPSAGGTITLPASVAVLFGNALPGPVAVRFEVDGYLGQARVGSGSAGAVVENGQHLLLHVQLRAEVGDGGVPDGSAGDGGVAFTVAAAPASGPNPTAVAAGDFNGDKQLDLVVADSNAVEMAPGDVRVLLGNGKGGFMPGMATAVGLYPVAVAVADFNNDQRDDVVVANGDPYDHPGGDVVLLLNNGSGALVMNSVHAPMGNPSALAARDVDGDGKPDLVVANSSAGTATLLRGTGVANLPFQPAQELMVGAGPSSIAIGDFNGDAILDVAVGSKAGMAVAVLTNSDGGVLQAGMTAVAGGPVSGLAAAKLNGDPSLDVAAALPSGVTLFTGAGDGTLAKGATIGPGMPRAVAAADFDGDGDADLVVADLTAGTVAVLRQGMAGAFDVAYTLALDTPSAVAIGDWNGDGKPDIAVTSFNGNRVTILINSR